MVWCPHASLVRSADRLAAAEYASHFKFSRFNLLCADDCVTVIKRCRRTSQTQIRDNRAEIQLGCVGRGHLRRLAGRLLWDHRSATSAVCSGGADSRLECAIRASEVATATLEPSRAAGSF